jgi:hypothetical protein
MADEWSYSGDPSTSDKDAVRFLIPDTDDANRLLLDREIEQALTLEDGDVRSAAALCLEVIASVQALILKVLKVMDVQTDGAKVSDALLKRADRLREQAASVGELDDAGFEIAELVVDPFTERERVWKEALRDLG